MIGIIYAGQIELSPFVKRYTDAMDREKIPYEIVHWNRSGMKMPEDEKNHTFFVPVERYGKLFGKILPFLRFRRYAKRIIREKKYDKLIILTTQTAVLLPDVILGRYRKKYFFDYRDTSYEYLGWYRRLVNRVILNAGCTAISSPGFREYLTDQCELVQAHNFQEENYQNRTTVGKKNTSGKIVMGYIGYLREYEYLKRFVRAFGSDSRFEFRIHGSGDCLDALSEYTKAYPNVRVFGAYDEKDKMSIVDSFDMICYNYPKSFVNYPAVANKFYDGLIRKKPMFGNRLTYSGMMIERDGLGISLLEDEQNITDRIYEYYQSFDEDVFSESCERVLDAVIAEDAYYEEKIRAFIR